ncbi:phage virion morphogenesis protein [Phocaeicola vulgatus]|jgi:phage gpG-like protein|uniref:phage virion morphogenesis protein n=1 Tax=Phocaeicola vulgatus TaxID=821 RepID=UPI0034A17460
MSGTDKNTRAVIRRILSDIRVELGDEFDRNFERQAFFSDAWARRKSPTRPGGTILVDTGTLRRSVKSRTTDDSITFYTDLPYAAIHNDGGEIVVTEKMKRFFWHKYYEATGSFGRKKNGERRNDKRTRQLSTEADFWRFMALKRAGTTIRIPRRRFLGTGPEVERIVREIIEDNLNEYFNMDFSIERK